jgi:hypothetical protein
MITQIKGVITNFIQGGELENNYLKINSAILYQPTTKGGLSLIDPNAQSETLLIKLFIKGLFPRGEPWK